MYPTFILPFHYIAGEYLFAKSKKTSMIHKTFGETLVIVCDIINFDSMASERIMVCNNV